MNILFVRQIDISSFRHLTNVRLGPFRHPSKSSDVVVLAGANGSGKSSVLELLGYALSSTWSLGWTLRRSFPTNAFEVELGLSPEERHLVAEFAEAQFPGQYPRELEHLAARGTYLRGYNYAGGEYSKNPGLHNSIHSLVTNALRNKYSRSLGFFLRSDRHYPTEEFRRNRLFEYEGMTKRDHIWGMAFNTSDVQYRDMFDFLVQQRYHYYRRLGAYHHQKRTSANDDPPPSDPLAPYDALLGRVFPGYSFAETNEEIPSNLHIQIPSGEVIPFNDLSSGEKEVFFILAFFLRHDVQNAIISIDEPELHLHPELARLLVRAMKSIRDGNQLWLATHNPEIVDEAGRDRVTYFSRDPTTRKAIATPATEEAETIRRMRDLFGYSGYLGVAKTMVFLEGTSASADRKVFANLFPDHTSSMKFIPASSSEDLPRLNSAIISLLEAEVGAARFYLIRDRDYLTEEDVRSLGVRGAGRLAILRRHEIENYLLHDEVISRVCSDLFEIQLSPAEVRKELQESARAVSGEVLRDMVTFRLNRIYRPQDFSMSGLLSRTPIVLSDGSIDHEKYAVIENRLEETVSTVSDALGRTGGKDAARRLLASCAENVRAALESDEWRTLYPGKRLLGVFSTTQGVGKTPALQNAIVKELAVTPDAVPRELNEIVVRMAKGDKLG